jgi:transposase
MPTVFSDEFKADAVALVRQGMTQKQVREELGISKSALFTWIKKAEATERGLALPDDLGDAREVRAALRRIRELEMENEVLRRAAAYLSQANLKSPK